MFLGGAIENEIISNQLLSKELHKSFIRKFEKHKIYSSFKEKNWSLEGQYVMVC